DHFTDCQGLGQILGQVTGHPATPPTRGLTEELVNPDLSSVRLVAGDGDLDRQRLDVLTSYSDQFFQREAPHQADGVMDWAVGEWRANGQSVAYSTTATVAGVGTTFGPDVPEPLKCPQGTQVVALTCQPNTDAPQQT